MIDSSLLEDNFGNLYSQPEELEYFLAYVDGAIESKVLRSGETVTDLLILQKPLDNARAFTLSADPGFYQTGDGGLLEGVSDLSFRIQFSRDKFQ